MSRVDIFADDYLLTQSIVRDVELLDGQRERVAMRGSQVYAAQQHGELWRRRMLDAGEFIVNMWIGDTSMALVEQWWDELMMALTPVHRLVRIRKVMAGGSQRECYAYFVEDLQPSFSGPLLIRAGFAMRIPSGRWQDVNDSAVSTALGSSL